MASSRARSHDLMIIRVTSESVKAQPDELTLAGKQKNANVIKDKLCCQERLKKTVLILYAQTISTPAQLVTK